MARLFNFSFLDKKPDEPVSGVASADQSSSGGPASAAVAATRAEIERDVSAATERKRRPQADSGTGAENSRILQAEINRQLEQCYDPKAWAALLALPGDAAHVYTGREYWKIGKEERETLGATGSAAARTLMVTDPRGLAFLMVASALFSVYVPRGIKELNHQRAEQAKKGKNETPS